MRWVQLCGSLKILWHCPSLDWNGTELFQCCGHCWVLGQTNMVPRFWFLLLAVRSAWGVVYIWVQDVLKKHWMETFRPGLWVNCVNWASYSTPMVLCLLPLNGGLDFDPAGLFWANGLVFWAHNPEHRVTEHSIHGGEHPAQYTRPPGAEIQQLGTNKHQPGAEKIPEWISESNTSNSGVAPAWIQHTLPGLQSLQLQILDEIWHTPSITACPPTSHTVSP